MKLDISAVRPALVNRAYRNAFRSGHGGAAGPVRQLFARLAFYGLEALRPPLGRLEVDLMVRGRPATLRLNPYNRQFSPLYFSIFADGYEVAVARSIARHLPDDGVFADVGSNWGYFPLLVASRSSFGGRIHAFEPIPSTYADLADIVAQAGLDPWIEPHHAAVGAGEGTVKMKLPRHSGLAAIDESGGGIEVPLVSLDSFAWDRLDVLKVDVEGFEGAVFEGARETLARCRPVVVFEDGVADAERCAGTLGYLEGLGYRLHEPVDPAEAARGTGHLECRPFASEKRSELPSYLNVVAIPEERCASL